MEKNASKMSGRAKVLDILGSHPEGLNAAKIRELLRQDYVVSDDHLAKTIATLAREGKIKNEGRHECSFCATRASVYKLKEAEHA